MRGFWLMLGSVAVAFATPAAAQMRTVDPNDVIDGDLDGAPSPQPQAAPAAVPDPAVEPQADYPSQAAPVRTAPAPAAPGATMASAETYEREDLIDAAEGVFGKGAEGLAGILENILKDQGKPNAYIAGREAAGAFIVGLRYGSGVMSHRVEGQRPVYWTGPSVGFDVGGDATKVFVLVYNLYDSQQLFERFPQAEGRAYFVGGFSASYLRRGDVVLIPVRLGVGWRLGANVGYMKFTEKAQWMPF